MGDLNTREIDFGSNSVEGHENSCTHTFFYKTKDLFVVQHVEEPNHYREAQTPAVLDYTCIFTNEENMDVEI